MIDCILTIDYEIFGNGEGSLEEHILKPTEQLKEVLNDVDTKLVFFVEAAELEKIEKEGSDRAVVQVNRQIRDLYEKGHEIGLHLHPQWCNAMYRDGQWELDDAEYNLCLLSKIRIEKIVDGAIDYLRLILGDSSYTPRSFRAGNWLFQPAQPVARILAGRGIKIDSSVFKGGLQRHRHLDYRLARKNGYYWKFRDDVNRPDDRGAILEMPIHTEMVPPWRMVTKKRLELQRKASVGNRLTKERMYRLLDRARFLHPLKLDFCRMTMDELVAVLSKVIEEDQCSPNVYRPIVAIGHTKDLVDFKTVRSFISYLKAQGIMISRFLDSLDRVDEQR